MYSYGNSDSIRVHALARTAAIADRTIGNCSSSEARPYLSRLPDSYISVAAEQLAAAEQSAFVPRKDAGTTRAVGGRGTGQRLPLVLAARQRSLFDNERGEQ